MQIQSGKLYENRTWKYLYPCLKHYGPELINYLTSFFKLAVGVADSNVSVQGNCIFILIDTNLILSNSVETTKYKANFSKFLDWVKYQYFYVKDYVYEGLDSGEKHMIVLKLPYKHDLAYMSFIKGKYSEMYDDKSINEYFGFVQIQTNKDAEKKVNDKLQITRKVLRKDSSLLKPFVDMVNKDFDTNVGEEHFKHAELDYPPKLSEEVFNYKKTINET